MFRRFAKNKSGATAVEYGLIVAVLSLAIVAGVGNVADSLAYLWGDNSSKLQQGLR